MESCIYEGQVSHTRREPARHEFRYRLFLMYLDLHELETVFNNRWLWSATRPALARFRRRDHFGPQEQSLDSTVRDRVASETGSRPIGPIRLLTNLSYFGYCFNPVSFYYCFDSDGKTVEYIVAEVSNTPWGECDTYVLDCRTKPMVGSAWRFSPAKKMHVSPFMPMDVQYDWALSPPQESLSVLMSNSRDGVRTFNAAMSLRRRAINGRSLASVLLRFPLQTCKIIAAIYWEALQLWVKGIPFHPHPGNAKEAATR